MIGPRTGTGARPHRIGLYAPGEATPNGDGGFDQSYVALNPPALFVEIKAATAENLERVAAGTVLSQNQHIVTGPFHAQVTTQTQLVFNGRLFNVTGVMNVDERNVEMVIVCVELLNAPPPIVGPAWAQQGWMQ